MCSGHCCWHEGQCGEVKHQMGPSLTPPAHHTGDYEGIQFSQLSLQHLVKVNKLSLIFPSCSQPPPHFPHLPSFCPPPYLLPPWGYRLPCCGTGMSMQDGWKQLSGESSPGNWILARMMPLMWFQPKQKETLSGASIQRHQAYHLVFFKPSLKEFTQ